MLDHAGAISARIPVEPVVDGFFLKATSIICWYCIFVEIGFSRPFIGIP